MDARARAVVEHLTAVDRWSQQACLDTDFRGAVLDGVVWGAWWFGGSNFAGVSLRGANLSDVHLESANLRGADLTGAVLFKASLCEADASRAVFRDADLRGAEAMEGVFRGADFRGAALFEANFARADLRSADFGGVSIDGLYAPRARVAGVRWEGMRGTVMGPLDVRANDDSEPELLDGDELTAWFRQQGAPELRAWTPDSSA